MTRALVLGGGGSKGAFAVGAIEVLRQAGITWDIIVGCSTGALIAPLVALDEITELVTLYSTVTNDDIYRQRQIWEYLGHRSIYDSAPLWALIQKTITPERYARLQEKSNVHVLATHMQSGSAHYFSPAQDLDRTYFMRAMLASASQPLLFPLVEVYEDDHQQYCDGGVVEVVPLKLPIGLGAGTIDVIMLTPEQESATKDVYKTFTATAGRVVSALTDTATESDLGTARLINKLILWQRNLPNVPVVNPLDGKRLLDLHVIRPAFSLTDNSLDFDPPLMRIMMEQGRDAAKQALATW